MLASIVLTGQLAVHKGKSNDRFQTPKSECYFWLNHYFIKGNFKHKKWRTDSNESMLRYIYPNEIALSF